jgi:hypothetical protein
MLGSLFRWGIFVTFEDRIRNLCTQLLVAQDDEEIQKLVTELKTAIHDHCSDLKVMATVSYPRSGKRSDP